ncbi:MAG TPA: hypothetical protein VF304_02730 [Casimicrobiaceae bacterium]
MNASKWMQVAVMTSAFGFASAAVAADNGSMEMNRNDSMGMGHSQATAPLGKTPDSVGANDQSQQIPNMDTWMNDYATAHNGRISREEFMDQMGRRWDRYDTQRNGYLTPEQARGIYSDAPPRSGSDVDTQDMGPNNARGK